MPGCDTCGPVKPRRIQYNGVEMAVKESNYVFNDSSKWSDTQSMLIFLKTEAWVLQQNNFHFGYSGQLYACDPAISYNIRSTVDSLWLTTENDIGTAYKSGNDITHLFEAEFNHSSTYQSLPYFIRYSVHDSRTNPFNYLTIRLRSKPDNASEIRLKAHLKTMDGNRYASNVFTILF